MHPSWLPIAIALLTVAAIVVRPWRVPEWVWAVAGASAETICGAVGARDSWIAVAAGANVYAFLIGVLALAETARSQSVFVWLAGHAERLAAGSRLATLALVYGAGIVVTALLSNDTTVIALTPAAVALARRLGGSALPAAFACAFVANAASFVLPGGNPANVLIYGAAPPGLGPWLAAFLLPAGIALLITFAVLLLLFRTELREPIGASTDRLRSTPRSRIAATSLGLSAGALVVATAVHWPLGYTALACAALTVLIVAAGDRSAPRFVAANTAWSVVPLVAGLLVIVAALDRAGLVSAARAALAATAHLPPRAGILATGWGAALASNSANNLPVAAFVAQASAGAPHPLLAAATIGIDVGPNLSVTGSLATLLWLVVLRREGIVVTPRRFFFFGAATLAPALTAALLLAR